LYLIVTLGAVSLLLAYILTPFIRDTIGHLGFLDHPDDVRKKHSAPVPRVGGIAIALSYTATFAIAFILPFSYTSVLHNAFPDIWKLSLIATIVFVTGLLDDLVGLRPLEKLIPIVLAGVLAYWAGIRVDTHVIPALSQHAWLGFATTVIWLVGCTNAFNLIDGLDGLAAGVGLFATLTMLLAALTQPNTALVLAIMPLAGCLLGFLRYNFNPASVFLGDSGSLLVGFLLGCYGALWSAKSVALTALAVPVLAVSVPLVDAGLSIVRRFLRNRPIFQADSQHIHHKLLDRGFSPRAAVLVIYGVCLCAAISSLVVNALHNRYSGLFVFLFCAAAGLGVQYLGYGEFAVAGRMLLKGRFWRIIDAKTRMIDLEANLARATDLEERWRRILMGSREFGFDGVRMSLAGVLFEDSSRPDARRDWQLRISLSETEYISFSRELGKDSDTDPLVLSAFVRCVVSGLEQSRAINASEAIARQPARELIYAAGVSATAAQSD
jgi:UDP-GlcNAc:undecaprenyl-phosphate GlcNAc-1-phosphate transferase